MAPERQVEEGASPPRALASSFLTASGRDIFFVCAAIQASSAFNCGGCKRTPTSRPLPVAGGPRFRIG